MTESERKWDSRTKRTVALVLLVVLALIIYRFRVVLPPLVLAFLLAFVLDPVVDFLEERARLSRTAATALVFLLVVLVFMAAPAVAVPPIVRAIRSLNLDFSRIVVDVARLTARPITLFGQEWDLRPVYGELWKTLQSYLSEVAAGTVDVVVGFASTLFWLVFILLSAFYLVRDADRIIGWVDSLPPPAVREDLVELRKRITDVWHAFLRGQLVMATLLAIITTVAAAVVGLPNAIALGVLAGVTEFVPNIGPVIAAVPAVAVALFEGSTWIPLSNMWFAVLVLGVYILIQQIEGNVLLPRVMGQSLDLHPMLVLIAVIAGGSLAGVLGMLVAAPTLATLRVLGKYIYWRLTDRPPFPEETRQQRPRMGLARRLWNRVRRRALADRWIVRPARPEDRADVEAICARIGQGSDYIPDVWDEWLSDPYGELLVVELKGRVVAVGKLSRIVEDEWWLEGLRVDPAYHRIGVARLIQDHQIAKADQLDRGILRFGTASYNLPVHRNAARSGFRRVAEFRNYQADPLPGPCPLRRLTPDDEGAAWTLIQQFPLLQAAGGLYEIDWHWIDLTRDRLATHLLSGEVWGLDLEGKLAALAIVRDDFERGRLSTLYLDGSPEAITALTWGLRVLVGQRGLEGLRMRPPAVPALGQALEAAGATSAWEHTLWIFERPLGAERAVAQNDSEEDT